MRTLNPLYPLLKGSFKSVVNLSAILLVFIPFLIGGCSNETLQSPILPSKTPNREVSSKQPSNVPVSISPENEMDERDSTYNYRTEGRRDPFKSLLLGIKEKKTAGLTPLQQRSLGELRVIGIIWGAQDYMAMIETPDGKGFLIREGTLIGPEGGVVNKITEDSIIIEEIYTDYYGRKRPKKTVLRLHAKEEGGG